MYDHKTYQFKMISARFTYFIFELIQTVYAIFLYYYKFFKVVYNKIAYKNLIFISLIFLSQFFYLKTIYIYIYITNLIISVKQVFYVLL
jgi:hypothetical protein